MVKICFVILILKHFHCTKITQIEIRKHCLNTKQQEFQVADIYKIIFFGIKEISMIGILIGKVSCKVNLL